MGETEEGFILGYRKGRDPQYLECDSVEAFEPEWLRIDMENKMAHKTRHARRHLELNCGRPLAGENSTRMQHNRPGGVWAWRVLELSCDPHLMGTIALIFLSRALGGTVSFGLFYTVRYARLIWICLGIVVAGGAKTPHRCSKMEGRTEGGEGREEGGREGVSGI